jgi:PAS domain S-box-containing protein
MQTLICIGDSLTEGADIPVGHTWPALAANALSLKVVNGGIGGDTTGGMLSRFYPQVAAEKPAFVLIMGGTNDLWWGLDVNSILANLFSMVVQARHHGIAPVIGVPLPVDVTAARASDFLPPWGGYARFTFNVLSEKEPMNKNTSSETAKEISCRITRTLLLYVRENNRGTLGNLLDGLSLDEGYLSDTNNWVSHSFLQVLYARMIEILGDQNAVYHMTLASGRFRSLGILDRIVRLMGSPKLIYSQAPKYNKFLKLNGSVFIHDIGDSWVVLEDRYHNSAQKTRFDCDYTRGILAGIPTMFGLPPAKVEEVKCQVAHERYGRRIWPDNPAQGCTGCFYRVAWMPKKISFLKRFFAGWNSHRQAIEDLVQANQLIQSKYDEVKQLAADLERTNQELARQQSQLVESERKYRLLAENVSDTIWVIDLKTLKFDYISPSVAQNRGFTTEEAKALSLEQTLSPSSLALVVKTLEAELAVENTPGVDPQRSRRIEIEHSLKGGGYTWAEATVSFIRDRSGVPTAIMGVTRDISERKKAEKKISENEKKYRNLFENGSDLICIHDLDGNLLETNIPFKKEYGWRREDLEGKNIRDLIPERYKPKFDGYIDRILTNGADEGYQKAFARSGDAVILEYRNRLIRDDHGQPMAVQCAARDVTERVRYERAIKESEEKYKELVKHAPSGIFEVDLQTITFISVNNVICEYTGYTEQEMLQMDPLALFSEPSREKAQKAHGTGIFNPSGSCAHGLYRPGEKRPATARGHDFQVLLRKRCSEETHDGRP